MGKLRKKKPGPLPPLKDLVARLESDLKKLSAQKTVYDNWQREYAVLQRKVEQLEQLLDERDAEIRRLKGLTPFKPSLPFVPDYPTYPSFPEFPGTLPYAPYQSPCLHKTCTSCHGTGYNKSTGRSCVHNISCPCPSCSPSYMGPRLMCVTNSDKGTSASALSRT